MLSYISHAVFTKVCLLCSAMLFNVKLHYAYYSVVIHTTNCASSALLFALLPQSLPLHLSMPSCSSTRLLQLTLCWPPSWAVTVPRQGPAHCRTPLWVHPQIWPRFQVYAGCAPLAPPPTEDFVPYNFLNLAVAPGSCSCLSSRPLPHYHGNSGSSLSPLNRAGSSSRPICPHCNYAESRLLSCWSLALEWAIFGAPIVP